MTASGHEPRHRQQPRPRHHHVTSSDTPVSTGSDPFCSPPHNTVHFLTITVPHLPSTRRCQVGPGCKLSYLHVCSTSVLVKSLYYRRSPGDSGLHTSLQLLLMWKWYTFTSFLELIVAQCSSSGPNFSASCVITSMNILCMSVFLSHRVIGQCIKCIVGFSHFQPQMKLSAILS